MNAVTEARSDVKAALEAISGLSVFDHFPERLATDKAAVVSPGDPYVVPGQVFGEFKVSLKVTVLTRSADNQVVTKALDDLIVNSLDALHEFSPSQAATPYIEEAFKPVYYLASEITINTTYKGGN